VPTVGGVAVVVIGDEITGFQILNRQNVGSVIGNDSGSLKIISTQSDKKTTQYLLQKSVPLATPIRKQK
jgi:hypothetical protein